MNGNALKWVEALESGEFTQAQAQLKYGDSFCCLGVACEVYSRETGNGSWNGDIWVEEGDSVKCHLPRTVQDWLGLRTDNGSYTLTGQPECCLIDLNDSRRAPHSFAKIAEVVRSEPPGLFWEALNA